MSDLNICRVCAGYTIFNISTQLFDKKERYLLRQIKEITGCSLRNSKKLPQLVCNDCKQNLQQAYEFRKQCLNAQAYFDSANFKEQLNRVDESLIEETVVEIKDEDFSAADKIDTLAVNIKHENEVSDTVLKNECSLNENSLDSVDDAAEFLAVNPLSEIVEPAKIVKSKSVEKAHASKKMIKRKKLKSCEKTDFICDQCGNHFTSRQHFSTHLLRHSNDKPFQCEVCPNKFFTHSELKRHMRRHTGERPFACKHCQRRFTDYSSRVKHERTHTNERPFACTHCGKAFTTSYILKNHILMHTGERSFKCLLCNRSFQRQSHLTVHYRSLMHKQMIEKKGDHLKQESTLVPILSNNAIENVLA